ncbi:energy-coupling factor ABC transporter permease [Clostridium sp. SHJSY1]|uniref:energy-coupling factor ABC transporter permease n=1 Tax=Clostridium sp. SHJSY1 TaxID=2942483 RepID=UPI0028744AFD|nr:energy-coupling factor ABC transporter permease [Clostridium sp. SHJSY1]MDS0528206.1 energy-coupling factor ABC transporter permease [Clostridium sp. SHJSY1]
MNKKEKSFLLLSIIISITFGFGQSTKAMHIMEGYLPPVYCILWGALCIPFLLLGLISIKRTINEHRKTLLILAMVGAYCFTLSALKIPSVSGSSSHPTGTGLGAILFGPTVMSVIGIIVLLFQAILLAHGGLTTLGANTFSMAIAGPILSYIIYRVSIKVKMPKMVAIFLAACLGDLFTYCITSIQLALAYPSEVGGFISSLINFMSIFAITQIPLAIIEGILTVIVIMGLESYAKSELSELGYFNNGGIN